jgi:intergrase/recombinase
MTEQGVQDRYIDAFCGRTPKSVLARHYTDYSLEKLKRVYDITNLKVLDGIYL